MIQKIAKLASMVLLACFVSTSVNAQSTLNAGPSSSASGLKSKAPAIEKSSLGETRNVHRAGDLYFAGQFSKEDLEQIKSEEFARIITLRMPGEIEWDERQAVQESGIEFVEVPFREPDTMTDEVIDEIRKLLSDRSTKTLFHCGSANRVGGVWLPYRVLDERVDLKTALAEAKQIGLRNEGYEKRALAYIQQKQGVDEPVEKSVKPGINEKFVDPELDVDNFIGVFEVESREVYANREAIIKATAIKAGDQIADIGAGTGLFTRMFSAETGENGQVFAVDISPKFIAHIKADATEKNLANVSAVLCDEKSVNLPDNSVDVVFICDTYHHFEYPQSTLRSIHAALKKGGHLYLIDFERIPGESREWLLGHVRAGKEVFRSEIQDSGFALVEEKKIDGFKENYFLKFRKD